MELKKFKSIMPVKYKYVEFKGESNVGDLHGTVLDIKGNDITIEDGFGHQFIITKSIFNKFNKFSSRI